MRKSPKHDRQVPNPTSESSVTGADRKVNITEIRRQLIKSLLSPFNDTAFKLSLEFNFPS